MTFHAEISNIVDEKEWNNKLLQNKASSTYQTPNWVRVYEESFDSKPFFIKILDGKGEIVGQLCSVIHKKFLWADTNAISKILGLKLNLQSLFTWHYGPIIHDVSNQDDIISLILNSVNKIASENNVTMIKGTPSPLGDQFSSTLFEKNGFELGAWATYIVDLKQNIDNFYNSLDKKTRYDIRKTEKEGLEFEIANSRSSLTEYEELKFQEKKRSGEKAVRQPLFLDKRWELLCKPSFEKLFLVRYHGQAVGAILNEIFNGNIIQHGVVNSEKKDLQGGSFLTWNTLRWSITEGLLTYDMGGVHPNPDTEKEKRIHFFKSKWGGKQVNYMRYTKTFGVNKLKISKAVKEPKRVTKKINKIFHKISI